MAYHRWDSGSEQAREPFHWYNAPWLLPLIAGVLPFAGLLGSVYMQYVTGLGAMHAQQYSNGIVVNGGAYRSWHDVLMCNYFFAIPRSIFERVAHIVGGLTLLILVARLCIGQPGKRMWIFFGVLTLVLFSVLMGFMSVWIALDGAKMYCPANSAAQVNRIAQGEAATR